MNDEEGSARGVHARSTYAQPPTTNEALEDDTKNTGRTKDQQQDLSNVSLNSSPPCGSSVNDQQYNTSALPDGTPAFHYLEAKIHYRFSHPPFLQKKKASAITSTPAILATRSGEYPEEHTKVNIITRTWDDKAAYWTLDLDGKRWIVKNFSGGPFGGARIIPWLGNDRGFANKPLAFVIKGPGRYKASPAKKKANKAVTPAKGQAYKLKHEHKKTMTSKKPTAPAAKDHHTFHPGSKPPYHVKPIEGSLADPKSAETHKILFTHQPGDVPRIIRKSSTSRHTQSKPSLPDRLRTARLNIRESIAGQSLTKLPTETQQETGESRDTERFEDETSDSSFEASTPRTQPKKRRAPDDGYCELTAPPQPKKQLIRKNSKLVKLAVGRPTQSASKPSSPNPPASPPLDPDPIFSLPAHKINATTVRVRISPSMDFVPLSLRSCMTVPTFYASTLGAWDIEESNLATVKVGFPWLPAETMVMRRTPADVFEWLLKTIDEAPCWDKGGKCEIGVKLMLR